MKNAGWTHFFLITSTYEEFLFGRGCGFLFLLFIFLSIFDTSNPELDFVFRVFSRSFANRGSNRVANTFGLQHDHTNSAHLLLIGQVLVVDSTGNRGTAVVVQIKVKLSVTSAELKLLKEERVILQGESVEDIELGLR